MRSVQPRRSLMAALGAGLLILAPGSAQGGRKGDTFSAAVSLAVSSGQPRALVAGDFNYDGKLDVGVANSLSTSVSVLFGDGTRGFDSVIALPVGLNPQALAAAD